MLAGDAAVLDDLCSDDLIYTHSKADYDDKRSYLRQVGARYFTYLEITHPADRILVVDSAALVTGRMTAEVLVAGTIVHIDNRYLAVWGREGGAWRFVAYQPTPDHRRLTQRLQRPGLGTAGTRRDAQHYGSRSPDQKSGSMSASLRKRPNAAWSRNDATGQEETSRPSGRPKN
jgi:hypothetical protein